MGFRVAFGGPLLPLLVPGLPESLVLDLHPLRVLDSRGGFGLLLPRTKSRGTVLEDCLQSCETCVRLCFLFVQYIALARNVGFVFFVFDDETASVLRERCLFAGAGFAEVAEKRGRLSFCHWGGC